MEDVEHFLLVLFGCLSHKVDIALFEMRLHAAWRNTSCPLLMVPLTSAWYFSKIQNSNRHSIVASTRQGSSWQTLFPAFSGSVNVGGSETSVKVVIG